MYWSLVPFLAMVIVTAGSGVFFKPGAWYETLRKPSWTPPNWLFGPVWSTLYIMIAVAGWLVWRIEGLDAGAGRLGAQPGLQRAVVLLLLRSCAAWTSPSSTRS